MRPLQILINKYTTKRQEFEFEIEAEINKSYPNIDRLDALFENMAKLNIKEGYLNKLLIDIHNARNGNEHVNNTAE